MTTEYIVDSHGVITPTVALRHYRNEQLFARSAYKNYYHMPHTTVDPDVFRQVCKAGCDCEHDRLPVTWLY